MESLVLFDSVVNSRWFMRTSIILFLNKVDLFRQKLGRSPLSNYFPDYSGGNDVNRAAKYLLWRFNQVNRAHLNLYPQYVQLPFVFRYCITDCNRLLVSHKPPIQLIFVLFSPPSKKPFYKTPWKIPVSYDNDSIPLPQFLRSNLVESFLFRFVHVTLDWDHLFSGLRERVMLSVVCRCTPF